MNEQLRKLVEQAGAPADLLNEIWFHVFCQKFANLLLTLAYRTEIFLFIFVTIFSTLIYMGVFYEK